MSKAEKDCIIDELNILDLVKGNSKRKLTNEELLNRGYYRGRFCNKYKNKEIFNWDEKVKTIPHFYKNLKEK